MEVRPGYKMTEVGVIPEDWIPSAVGAMGEVVTGKALAVSAPGDQRAYLRTKNVFDGRIDIDDVLSMPMTEAQFNHFALRRGDVLLNEGQSIDLVGRCAIYRHEYPEPCAIQNQLLRFRARTGVSGEYASHLFRYSQQTGVFARIALQTTSIAHLGGKRFEKLVLSWPPTEAEQGAIAAALSDLDALLGGLERLISKKRDLKQAAMQQLLTGLTRLPGFHGEWELKRLEEVAEVKTGPFGSSLHESDYVQDGTPIITVEHLGEFGVEHVNLPLVSDADRRRLKAYSLADGDIVFSRVGSVDRNALIRPSEVGWLFSGRLLRIRPHKPKVYAPFLSYQFHSEPFKTLVREAAVGQTMASLNTKILNGLRITMPALDEQTAIAAVLSDMDAELSALEARRDKTRALKQGMMQALLTGRIRLLVASSNVVPVDFATKPKPAPSDPKSHNWQFNEAVVVAMLVKQFGSEQYPLGRKRCTKLGYLMHRHVERVAQGYLKKAAGPYNPAVKYKGPETIAQKNGYIRPHTSGKFSGFVAAGKIAEAEGYFDRWYGREVLAWLEQFRHQTNDELELLATVDMAIVDVTRVHAEANVAAVKSIILDHPEWKTKLEREIFSDANIARAIGRVTALFAE